MWGDKMLDKFTSYFLILFSAALLTALGITYICCDSKQLHSITKILLLVVVGFDALVTMIKITPLGMILKALLFSIPFGIVFVFALVATASYDSIISSGIIIGTLDIANIIFYAYFENVETKDVYYTTEPGVRAYKKEYKEFNDFAALPKTTLANYLINIPSRILILILSLCVGLNTKKIVVSGKTTKILDESCLKPTGIIYLVGALLYFALFTYFIIKDIKNRKKGNKERNIYETDVERDIRESINSRNC